MSKNKLSQNDIVLVTWLDAVSFDPWTETSEAEKLQAAKIFSVGHLIKYDEKKEIIIAGNFDSQNFNYSCMMCIPVGMIVSVKRLSSQKKY